MGKAFKRLDWGHVAFVVFIAVTVVWYFADAYAASATVANLILIAPATALALGLCALILVSQIRATLAGAPSEAPSTDGPKAAWGFARYRPMAFIGVFGLYILGLVTIGYDVASWLFIAATMALNGERRLWMIVGYSVGFGTLAVWLFGLIIPYPMPTLVVPSP